MAPRWLSWLFVAVMLYMIYVASQSHRVTQPSVSVPVPLVSQETNPGLAEAVDVERWKRTINPDYAATMNCSIEPPKMTDGLAAKVIEDSAGEGEPAQCGQQLTIHLTVWNQSGGKTFSGELPLALGSRELAAGLDAGLLGMKPGAVRTLLLPPETIIRNKNAKANAAVKALPQGKMVVVTVKRVK